MADTKTHDEVAISPLDGTEELYVVGSGGTVDGKTTTAAIAALSPAGTVTSVGGTGTVNGLTLSGTVTTSGNLTLGGTLSLASPPAIGGTTPSTGVFTYVRTVAVVLSSLPSAATAGVGARAFITDGSTTIILGIGTTAVGGGSNNVPVYSDGTNWIIG